MLTSQVNIGKIMNKVNHFSAQKSCRERMKNTIDRYRIAGVGHSKAGDKITTEKDMTKAAETLIEALRSVASSYDLPESVLSHFDSLRYSQPVVSGDYAKVDIRFDDDLHRNSLYPEKYPEGVDNIIALFNNGYKADNYVYGVWQNHSATAGGRSDKEGAYIRSRLSRGGLSFMQRAVEDFNQSYGAKYNVTAVLNDRFR